MIRLTCFAYKTSVDPHLEDRDLQKQQQQHHNLEESSFHKLRLLQKYLQVAHHQQELQEYGMAWQEMKEQTYLTKR